MAIGFRVIVATLLMGLAVGARPAGAAVTFNVVPDLTDGYSTDVTYESVRSVLGAAEPSLSQLLAAHPLGPITRPGGAALIVGDVDIGQDPTASDQTQIQRLAVVGDDAELRITYLGGVTGFSSVLGVYSYPMSGAPPATGDLTLQPLVTGNVTPVGTDALFTVPADHYFAFYGIPFGTGVRTFFTENARNTDVVGGVMADHFLLYETNRGLVAAFEDLAARADGRLGDADYQDNIFGFLSLADGTPIPGGIPEPGTAWILAGVIGLLLRRRGGR